MNHRQGVFGVRGCGRRTSALFVAVTIVVCSTMCSDPAASESVTVPRNLRKTLEITSATLPAAAVDSPYSSSLSAAGGTPPYTWSITSGALPPGFSLAAGTGVISGKTDEEGEFSFTAEVQDSSQTKTSKTLALSVLKIAFDKYGGRTDISCTATGYFHTQKIGNRWWLCTPEGHGFFRVGASMTVLLNPAVLPAKYGNQWGNWVNNVIPRLKQWNFNVIDVNSNVYLFPTETAVKDKMTAIPSIAPEGEAMQPYPRAGLDVYTRSIISEPVKSLWNAMPASFVGWSPKFPDMYDDNLYAALAFRFAHENFWKTMVASPYLSYILGISVGETDSLFGFQAGDLNRTNSRPVPHMGWDVLAGSPVQTAGAPYNRYATFDSSGGSQYQFIYTDREVKSKTALKNFLKNRYGTIQALNTAWGSSYTGFDSAGTQVVGETVATGDGRYTAYNYKLAHLTPSRFSLQILVNGTPVAGELHHDNGDGSASPGIVTSGRIWGPYVTGKITPVTGAISPTFKTTTNIGRSFAQISTDGSTVTVHTMYQHGMWTGAKVTISGTLGRNYDGTYSITSVADSFHFTFTKRGNFTATAQGVYALAAVPKSSDKIAVNYIYNGWEIGTGLMDEANNHSWSAVDPTTRFLDRLPSVKMQVDLDDFLEEFAFKYFSSNQRVVNAVLPSTMYLGPGSVSTWGWPSRAPVLKAAGRVLPILPTGYGHLSQAGLDYIYQYFGDKPVMDNFFGCAQADSYFSAYPKQCSYSNFATQEERGQAYYDLMANDLAQTTNGVHTYAGLIIWGYAAERHGEQQNLGLVSYNDNAYDGHEAVSNLVTCSPPLDDYACGGEAANYGDVVTKVKQANTLWLTIE